MEVQLNAYAWVRRNRHENTREKIDYDQGQSSSDKNVVKERKRQKKCEQK